MGVQTMFCLVSQFGKLKDYAMIPLRVALALVMVYHGWPKLMGGAVQFFTGLFGAAGPFLSYFVGVVEVLGGILLLLGLFTRHAALFLSIVMIVAIISVHLGPFKGYEFQLTLLAGLLTLLFNGAGKYGLEQYLFKKEL